VSVGVIFSAPNLYGRALPRGHGHANQFCCFDVREATRGELYLQMMLEVEPLALIEE
jgi:hypothetical protein